MAGQCILPATGRVVKGNLIYGHHKEALMVHGKGPLIAGMLLTHHMMKIPPIMILKTMPLFSVQQVTSAWEDLIYSVPLTGMEPGLSPLVCLMHSTTSLITRISF